MANNWFQFKEFKIVQSNTAMKVGTDGVLLGAWTPLKTPLRILDVGTGTGLIAIMLAQRNSNVHIDAIDIDNGAVADAHTNVMSSPWSDRINVLRADFNTYVDSCDEKYDLIVSNPPFFENGNQAPDKSRALARHSIGLSPEQLLVNACRLLHKEGCLALVLPPDVHDKYLELANRSGLYQQSTMTIYPTPQKPAVRILSLWGWRFIKQPKAQSLVIESGGRHVYSEDYKILTKDFYLNF
ncbi:tRNA1(Val) (adenine(37)-N6)-methyltransferase [Geofilum sp. OHC36d9]|uniref:tRNA1(Val) (adenine(37)-N6)-methyltransferase n=1 Tax=Geofilum sp. OHC36d9 TaxID=3458413 RepID=UPI00403402AD